mgnify:CR=1 FL=1|jgi:hypothetical protein
MKIDYIKAESKDHAYELATAQITDEYIAKFKVKAEVNYNKDAGKIEAKGKGFTLTLSFDDSAVTVELKLSFLLKPLKGKVMGTIEKKIKKTV